MSGMAADQHLFRLRVCFGMPGRSARLARRAKEPPGSFALPEAEVQAEGDCEKPSNERLVLPESGGPTPARCLTALELLLAGGSGHEYQRRCLSASRANPTSWPTGHSSRGIFYHIMEAAAEAAFNVKRKGP